MYEESAAVPLIMRGPGVPENKIVRTTVSLLDAYPTVLDCVVLDRNDIDLDRPSKSLWNIACEKYNPERIAFSEYHAVASPTGVLMVRQGRFKLIHYVDHAPQLFDIEVDPLEQRDLASSSQHSEILATLQIGLRSICNPEEVERRAKNDQAALVEMYGGREAVIARGSFSGTPAPGEKPVYG